jgi:lipoprotein-anchoring transpeptidase ErfK/SrfK
VDVAGGVASLLDLAAAYDSASLPEGPAIDLDVSFDPKAIGGFVRDLADQVYAAPVDAAIDVLDGHIVVKQAKAGSALMEWRARRALLTALRHQSPSVTLGMEPVKPAVQATDLGMTIVVRLSQNQLYLYDGVKLAKSYPVATGQSQYPTPQGHFEIINKRINPTWVNPAKDTWGKDEPDFIPPGPDNPLGTRALDLDAPGIRIHGTYNDSSIGTYASHGCIRMHVWDSEDLFGRVGVGTPVIIAL